MRKNKNWLVLIFGLVLLLGLGQAAQAALKAVGPIDPGNGFPTWYSDFNDLTLELCLPNAAEIAAAACFVAGPPFNPALPIVFPTNFPDESFYFVASATLDVPNVPIGGGLTKTGRAVLTLAVEAAFSTGSVSVGGQITFGRLRYVLDLPVAGTYTITTPYGIFTEVVDTPGPRAVFVSNDIGVAAGIFTGALATDIGPFLRASLTPGGAELPLFNGNALRPGAFYLLNPAIATTAVTGGRTGNIFSVVGPGVNIQTDQFSLQGRLSTGLVPTSLSGVSATYSRPAVGTGFVDVFANSAATAILTIAQAGQIPATTMITDPSTGRFSARIPITKTTILPASLAVTADQRVSNPFTTPTSLGANLTDRVTVTSAEHDAFTRILTIQAVSSDEVSPPVLTATGFGNLVNGKLTINNVINHPGVVTVTSSKGGSGTRDIITVSPISDARATYCRPAVGNGDVSVFARSSPTALLAVSDPTGKFPKTNMVTDLSSGNFFAQIPLIPTGSTILPAGLIITATSPLSGIAPVSIGVDLTDTVTITISEYVPLEKTLSILATSCDALAPPKLTAVGFGELTSVGTLFANNVTVPPSVITVSSSKGGLDAKQVTIGDLRRYLPLIMKQ